MRHTISNKHGVRKRVMRDAHAPETIAVEVCTDVAEKYVVERNKAIRSAELMKQDKRNPMCDGDVIAFAFQFPTVIDYQLARRRDPDLFDRAEAGGDDGLRAAERLTFLYPAYVTTTKRGDARR